MRVAPRAAPFFGGRACLGAPIKRTPLRRSMTIAGCRCTDRYRHDFNPACVELDTPTTGQDVCTQYWGRDNGFPAPDNSTFSDGL